LPDSNTRWFAAPKARIALGTAATIGALALVPAAVQATPYSNLTCRGGLTKAQSTSQDPHYLNYSFHCSANIQSYTVVVNRGVNDFGTIDDFNVAPNVFNDALTQISSTETVDCEATTTPGNSINCFALSPGTPQAITAYDWLQGQIDTTDPFCGVVANKKKHIAAEPAASASLIVTDATGAEWGPFDLPIAKGCPKPAAAKKTTTKKHKKTTTKKK
jgi:hypothetical protein